MMQALKDRDEAWKSLKLMKEKIEFLDNLLLECDDPSVSELLMEWHVNHK